MKFVYKSFLMIMVIGGNCFAAAPNEWAYCGESQAFSAPPAARQHTYQGMQMYTYTGQRKTEADWVCNLDTFTDRQQKVSAKCSSSAKIECEIGEAGGDPNMPGPHNVPFKAWYAYSNIEEEKWRSADSPGRYDMRCPCYPAWF